MPQNPVYSRITENQQPTLSGHISDKKRRKPQLYRVQKDYTYESHHHQHSYKQLLTLLITKSMRLTNSLSRKSERDKITTYCKGVMSNKQQNARCSIQPHICGLKESSVLSANSIVLNVVIHPEIIFASSQDFGYLSYEYFLWEK